MISRAASGVPPSTMAVLMASVFTVSIGYGVVLPLLPYLIERLLGTAADAAQVYFRRRGARSTAVVLAAASMLVVTAASWDALERPLLKIVRANR